MQVYTAGVLVILTAALFMCPGALAAQFYVAPDGDDANAGTAEAPFASLERARDAVRGLKAGHGLPAGGITVILRGGTYPRQATFELTAQDSGLENARVVWRVHDGEEARLVGGVEVPAGAFSVVEDPAVLERLDEVARGNVLQADLGALGVTQYGEFPDRFRGAPTVPEVFFADQRMDLARWPNEGWAEVEQVVRRGARPRSGEPDEEPGIIKVDSDRLGRWDVDRGVWLNGYWCYDWYIETLRVAEIDAEQGHITFIKPHWYGIGGGNPGPRRFFAFNLLEELDRPGEYFIDREQGVLYFWPPAPVEEGRVVVSTLSSPVISLQDVSHVTLRGLTVEMCVGNGIEVRGGSDNRLDACVVRSTGHDAVVVDGGERHAVEACNIHDTGTAGLRISGGDRRTLTPCGHEAVNNHIYRVSRRQRTHAYHVHMGGVGVRVAHNLLHDGPHQAIGLSGNEHLIEFNEIFRTGMETDDCGSFYMGRNMSERGTVIRYNFWHDIGSELTHGSCAVYFDDGAGGQVVFGNIFLRAAGGRFGSIHIHGGHDNLIDNNIFIENAADLGVSPWNDARWASLVEGWQGILRHNVNVTEPPYSERYPDLPRFFTTDDEGNVVTIPGVSRLNFATRNVSVRSGEFLRERGYDWWQAWNNYLTDDDPGFVDAAGGNFALREDSVVFREIEGFQPIPFDRIGLYADDLRPVLPEPEWTYEPLAGPAPERSPERAAVPTAPKSGPPPVFTVVRTEAEPSIDGVINPDEWGGADTGQAILLAQDVYGAPAEPVSRAWLFHDGDALLVAVDNAVTETPPMRVGRAWGQDEAVELAFRNPAQGDAAPILILRGYADGHFESSGEAGALGAAVQRAAQGVQYGAQVVDASRWTAEWRIPFASLGVNPAEHRRLAFSLTVRKPGSNLWLQWEGTRAHSWRVDQAGFLDLAP